LALGQNDANDPERTLGRQFDFGAGT
jgi:hypothetical protein